MSHLFKCIQRNGKGGRKVENKHGPKDTSMRPMYTFYYVVLQVVQVCFYGLPQMINKCF